MPVELIALVGVVVGALLSWLASVVNERARFQRARQTYWRDKRLEAYVDFASATKSYMGVLFRIGSSMGVDPQTEPLTPDQGAILLASAFEQREIAFEKMRLVGSSTTCDAARTWVRAVYELRHSLDLADSLTRERWQELVRRANEGRSHFHQAAQSDLGVRFDNAR
jgi:hypothetical protein